MTDLPDGLTRRPMTPEDVDAVTALIAACEIEDDGAAEIDRDDVASIFDRPYPFDVALDTSLVLDGETPVAWAELHRRRAEADVHPSHRGRGIGAALASWSEERARAHG